MIPIERVSSGGPWTISEAFLGVDASDSIESSSFSEGLVWRSGERPCGDRG